MKNNKISVEDLNSSGIVSVCRESGITRIEKLGRFEHPDHPGSDWAITIYNLDTASGGRVAETNGDPVWEEADPSAFAELLAIYGIEL